MQRGWPCTNLSDPDPPAVWQWFFGSHPTTAAAGRVRPRTGNGWTGRDPHPRRHQRLPAAAGRHPDLRRGAAGPPPAGLGRRARLRLPGVGRASTPRSRTRSSGGRPAMLLPTPGHRARRRRLARRHGCDSVFFGAAAPLGLLAPALRAAGVAAPGRRHPRARGRLGGAARRPAAAAAHRRRPRRAHLPRRVHPRPAGAGARRPHPAGPALAGRRRRPFTPAPAARAVRERYGLGDAPVVVCVSRLVPARARTR